MSFLSLLQQVHQSAPLPRVRSLSVFPPLPNLPSPIHLSIRSIHPWRAEEAQRAHHRRGEGRLFKGQRINRRGGEVEEILKEVRMDGWMVGKRGVKGKDCRRDTVWPCVWLMYLWRKRIGEPLAHTQGHTYTHRLSVGITTLSLCWLIHYPDYVLLSVSVSVCQPCADRERVEHGWQQ